MHDLVSTLRTSYVNEPLHEAGQASLADGVGGAVGGADGDRLLARRRGHPQAGAQFNRHLEFMA